MDAFSAVVSLQHSSERVTRTEDHGYCVIRYFVVSGILQSSDGVVWVIMEELEQAKSGRTCVETLLRVLPLGPSVRRVALVHNCNFTFYFERSRSI